MMLKYIQLDKIYMSKQKSEYNVDKLESEKKDVKILNLKKKIHELIEQLKLQQNGKLIEEYEQTKRGIYSGCVGYISPEKDFDFNVVENFSDNKCLNCIFEPSCPTCYGMNYVNNGNMFNRDKTMCNIVKITALAVSYLKANQIESQSKEISPNDTYQTIKAIQLIQNQF